MAKESEAKQLGGNRRGGRTGHLDLAKRRTVLALKSVQMLTLERLGESKGVDDLSQAEASLKDALKHLNGDASD